MIDPCPCNGCTERFIACSGRCPIDARGSYGYAAWKAQHTAEQKHLADNKYRFTTPHSVALDKYYDKLRKQGMKGHKGGDQ